MKVITPLILIICIHHIHTNSQTLLHSILSVLGYLQLSYPELYLNPQGIPKSFPSHFHMIPESSPRLLSTLKYSQVSQVKPKPVHVSPYTRVLCIHVKSGSSGLKSDGGDGRKIEISYRGGPEVRRRYESGDLVRTWHRLMCHALAEVVVLNFRGMEVQRYGGKRRHEGGLRVRGWET